MLGWNKYNWVWYSDGTGTPAGSIIEYEYEEDFIRVIKPHSAIISRDSIEPLEWQTMKPLSTVLQGKNENEST